MPCGQIRIFGGGRVAQQEMSRRSQNPLNLREKPRDVVEVMWRGAARHEVNRIVAERYLMRVQYFELDVVNPARFSDVACLFQHPAGDVRCDHRVAKRGDSERGETGTGGDVKTDFVTPF